MGTPDSIWNEKAQIWHQVKCWDCQMRDYRVGDEVPDLESFGAVNRTYTIALLEPDDGVRQYFANVKDNVLHSITDWPIDPFVIDKWGGKCDSRKPYARCSHNTRCCKIHNTHSSPHRGCILR